MRGKTRELPAPERLDRSFDHLPQSCSGRGHGFTGGEQRLGEPEAAQKWELPVIEHRMWRLQCPACGRGQLTAGCPMA